MKIPGMHIASPGFLYAGIFRFIALMRKLRIENGELRMKVFSAKII